MSKYDQRSVMILARRYLCPKKYAKSQYPGPWLVGLLLFWALIGWIWLLDYFCSTLQSWIRIDNSWKIKDIIISFDQKRKKSKNIYKIPLTNKARSATGSVTSLDAWSHCLYPNTKQDTDSQFKICKVFTDASVRSDLKRVSRAAIIFRTCSWV